MQRLPNSAKTKLELAAARGSMPLPPPPVSIQKKGPAGVHQRGLSVFLADQSSSIGGASSLSFERGLVWKSTLSA